MATFDNAMRVQKSRDSVQKSRNSDFQKSRNSVKVDNEMSKTPKSDSVGGNLVQSRKGQNSGSVRGNLVQSRTSPKAIDLTGGTQKPPSGQTYQSGRTRQTVTAGTQNTQGGQNYYSDAIFDEDVEEENQYYDEDDEDYDDDDDDYYPQENLYYPHPHRGLSDGENRQRVTMNGGAEPCSCFPERSNKNVPSMLYENLKCKHSQLKGEAHPGVYDFDGNWNEFYKGAARQRNVKTPPKTKYVYGYPKPLFTERPETAETGEGGEYYEGEEYEGEDYEGDEYWDYYKDEQQSEYDEQADDENDFYPDETRSAWKKKSAASKRKRNQGYDSKTHNLPKLRLPQIGYSPPPSRERSMLSVRSQPYSLPPLPESPYVTSRSQTRSQYHETPRIDDDDEELVDEYQDKTPAQRRQKRRSAPVSRTLKSIRRSLETPRRFQGKYYDTALKKTLNYDIIPKFQKDPNDWRARLDEGTAKRGSRESRMPSKGITASGNRRRSRQIPEEDLDDDS